MEKPKIRTTVKIYGSEYLIESDDTEEYVHKVAFYVDKLMRKLSLKDIRLSTTLAAVLTAINIADERFKLVEKNQSMQEEILSFKTSGQKNDSLIKKFKVDNENLKRENERLKIELARAQTKLEGN